MCEMCGKNKCDPGFPNAEATCCHCGELLKPGQTVYDFKGRIFHRLCVQDDMKPIEILGLLGIYPEVYR